MSDARRDDARADAAPPEGASAAPAADAPSAERPVPRFSPGAKAGALVVALIVVFHASMTAVYNVPSAEIRERILPGAVARSYLEPFFQQNYRIFAPNPISEDRSLRVRAWVETASGSRRTTEWVDVTAAEISSFHRRLLRKQLTIVGVERLVPAFRALTEEQQDIADENWHESGFPGLREALLEAAPGTERAVDQFIRASEYVTAYGTQAAYALWGPDVVAVQVQAVYDPVIRWEDRNDPDARRPTATIVNPGWRPPTEFEGQDRERFAEIFRGMLDG